jgi:outer membrane protein TolC
MLRALPLIALIFVYCSPLAAQQGYNTISMTLEEALQTARKLQPDLLNANRNIAYAQAATREAKSTYLPKLTAEFDYRYNPIIQTSVLPANAFNPNNDPKDLIPIRFGTPWNGAAGLRLKQPLYEPEKLATINSSKLAEDLAKTQEKKIIAEREEEIIKAWYSIMLSTARKEFAQQDKVRSQSNETLIRNQVELGRALPHDLREAELKTKEVALNEETIGMDIFNAQVYLSYMIGYDTVQLIVPKEKLTMPRATIMETGDIGQEIALRADVQEQKLNNQISALELKQTRASRLPSLNLEGFVGGNTFTNKFNPFTNWYGNAFIGLVFRYPIFSGGESRSKIEQREIQYQQQQQNLRRLQQQAYYEILNKRTTAEQRMKQAGIEQERLRIQEEKISIVRDRLTEGRALAQDLLEEETRLAEIRDNLYLRIHDYMVAMAELRRASGKN